MKKIVFVIEQLSGGGAERVTAALANELCQRDDCQIHLAVYGRNETKDYPTDDRIYWHVLQQVPQSRIGAVMARMQFLRRTIRSIGADYAVSLGTPRIAVLLAFAILGTRTPLILSERNDPSRYPTTKPWRFLRTLSYYLADEIVFQTGGAMDYFSSVIKRKGTVISNPITANLPPRHTGLREQRIVNFCRLSPQKNLDLLIDAFSDICDKHPQLTLCIYGEGPERQHLEEKIVSLGLEDRISLPGYSLNIYEDIRDAALFVSSSDYEGISNSMLEAIALGVPSICTDCPAGGAAETIRHGDNGLLVPVGDRHALAMEMDRVLSDLELSEQLSSRGYLLRDTISVSSIARRWLNIIEKYAE